MSRLNLFVLLLTAAALPLQAAPAGRVSGTVKDPSGALMAAVEITAQNRATGARRVTATDSSGVFDLPLLEPGVWLFTAQAPQFKKTEAQSVIVQVDQATRLDLMLSIGEVRETATAAALTPLMDYETSTLGVVFDQQTIARLPLNGRQFLDLTLLAPGVAPTAPGTQGGGFTSSGARSQGNVYLLDGISNQDTQNNGPLNSFRITDAVQEFAVETGAPLPEFGRGTGGQVNIVTRSGSNQFHGSAFSYVRNTAWDAADFFTNKLGGAKNPLNRNQFGGTLGGRLARDRTFFFSSYEGFRQVAHIVSATRVPTEAERAGVTDAISQRLLPYWPLPNTAGTTNYIAEVRNQDSDNTGLMRIDHRLTGRDQLSTRWVEYRGYSVTAGPTPLSGGNEGPPAQRSFLLSETHLFSPHLLNDLRFGYSMNSQERLVRDREVSQSTIFTDAGSAPLPGVPDEGGLPSITISGGYAALGANQNFPQGRHTRTIEIFENITWQAPFSSRRHSWRFGVHVRDEDLRQYLNRSVRGTFNFSNFANFSRGLLNSASIRTGSTLANWKRRPWAFYWQDQFKLQSNLTLHFGLRYESPSASSERSGRATNFVPDVGPVLAGTRQVLGINPALNGPASLTLGTGAVALPPAGIHADRNNLAPMFGFAWAPLANTVVRGGFRFSFDDPFNNLLTSMSLAPPFNLQTTQTANVSQPGAFPWPPAFNQNVPLIANYNRQGPGTPTAGVIALQGLDPAIRTAMVYQYNLSVQRTFGPYSIEAAYSGSTGRKLGIYVDLNQPAVIVRDSTRRGPLAPNEQFFPNPAWGQTQQAKSIVNSSYNGFVVTARSQMRHGRFFHVSYRVGKSLDYNSSYFGSGNLPGETGAPPDSRNLRLEHGPSAFDVRQRFVALYGIRLPLGLQVDAVTSVQSGLPFTVVSGNPDSNGFNQSTAGVMPNGGNRPNLTHSGRLPQDHRNPDTAFDTSWFSPALAGAVGTSGRNQYYGPALQNFDAALTKLFVIREALQLSLRADLFNLLNHTNFANPVADMSNASFGRITQTLGSAASTQVGTSGGATGGPRVIQLSLRFRF